MNALNTLWFGDRLGFLERLSIASAMATGHSLTLYSYDHRNLKGVPEGVSVRDAREVMSDPRRTKLFDGKFKALGSDFFRYEIFHNQLGYWSDLDVIFLRSLAFENDHVFGWENDGISVNGAVLRLPRGPVLDELRNIPAENWCPPFFGPRRRLGYYIKRLKGTVLLEDLPWGAAGPAMITYAARKHGVLDQALPKEVFYPVPYGAAQDLFDDASKVEALIKPNTVAIHMWNSRLQPLLDDAPPPGSYIAEMCDNLGVSWSPRGS